jgi:1-acyl-sn-glycerol-3-phosphate acyltransferase
MAKSELFGIPILGGLMRAFGAFPVRRGAPDRASLRTAIQLLKAGEVVGMFPEGALTESGELQTILPGAGLVARQAGVPVICVGLRNTERVLPYGALVPRPGWRRIWAVWGEPKVFHPHDSNDEVVRWIESQLRSLCDEV